MKNSIVTLFALLCFSINAMSQSWQWGKIQSVANPGYTSDFLTNDQATDRYGNTYLLQIDTGLSVPGHQRKGYGRDNVVLTSFDAEGNYRWGRILQGYYFTENSIKVDQSGGVYLLLTTYSKEGATFAIDNDATISIPPNNTVCFLLKYSSSGAYQWHQYISTDTSDKGISVSSLCVTPDGTSKMLATFSRGTFCAGKYKVTDSPASVHVLCYNRKGEFQKGFKLDVNSTDPRTYDIFREPKMAWDYVHNQYYVYAKTLKFGTTVLNTLLPVGCFDESGKLLWLKQGLVNPYTLYSKDVQMLADEAGQLYIGCKVRSGGDVQYPYTNSLNESVPSPAIIKMDHKGNVLWISNSHSALVDGTFLFALAGNRVGVFCGDRAGHYGTSGVYKWGNIVAGTSYKMVTNVFQYNDSFNTGSIFAVLDTGSGAALQVDSLSGTLFGRFGISGNNSGDFFLSLNSGRVFSGSKSMQNTFIVPNKDTFITPYPSRYRFLVHYCSSECNARQPSETPDYILSVYPSPATAYITISNAVAGSRVGICNLLGQQVASATIYSDRQMVPVDMLEPGVYLIRIMEDRKQQSVLKFVKQ